jgi:Na+/melibiose symporter-like transporter
MKKEILLIVFLFCCVGLMQQVVAEDAPGLDDVPIVGGVKNFTENFRNNQSSTDYLKQEWRAMLETKSFGRVILKISDFFKNFNFFFKAVFGVEYSLSWSFIFAVIIWLTLLVLIYPILSDVFDKKLFGFIGAFVVVSLVGLAGIIKKAVDLLNAAIHNLWIALLALAIAVIITIIASRFGKQIGKKIEAAKEKAAKQQTAQDRAIIHTDAEVSKEKLEGYKEDK